MKISIGTSGWQYDYSRGLPVERGYGNTVSSLQANGLADRKRCTNTI